jgi:hypothetical protein
LFTVSLGFTLRIFGRKIIRVRSLLGTPAIGRGQGDRFTELHSSILIDDKTRGQTTAWPGDNTESLVDDEEPMKKAKAMSITLNNAHPLLKVLTPIVLDQVRFVRVFFCDHGIANYNGNGFILCRRSVMPMTSTAGQAHP